MSNKLWGLKLTLFLIIITALNSQPSLAEIITGEILDKELNPIQGAEVQVNYNGKIGELTKTDHLGYFEVDTGENASHLIIFADNNSTSGIDYIPAKVPINLENQIVLLDGTSLTIKGNVQLVDTENLPSQTHYSILDEYGQIITPMGIPLMSDTLRNLLKQVPSYNKDQLIVPADLKIKLRIKL